MKHGEYATHHRQLYPLTLRDVAKHICLSVLAAWYKCTGRLGSPLERSRVQFLYTHHILEDEVEPFRQLLRVLGAQHRIIGYSEAVERIRTGRIDAPYVCFSFDDGVKNCSRAKQVMDEFGVKACFFICPPMAEETDYDKIAQFSRQVLDRPPLRFLSWDDAEELLKDGHEIGSHTMTHRRISQLPAVEAQAEIAASFDLLTKRIGRPKHFAWPFARLVDFTPVAARTVFDVGFETCAAGTRACHTAPQADRRSLCIRRDDIFVTWPPDHTLYFMARNSLTASPKNNDWPDGWLEIIQGKNEGGHGGGVSD